MSLYPVWVLPLAGSRRPPASAAPCSICCCRRAASPAGWRSAPPTGCARPAGASCGCWRRHGAGAVASRCRMRPPTRRCADRAPRRRRRSIGRGRRCATIAHSSRLILGFKRGGRLDGVALFARWMAQAGEELLADADLILPVPLHRWRLLTRGFNQSAVLAQRHRPAHRAGLGAEPAAAAPCHGIAAGPRRPRARSEHHRRGVPGPPARARSPGRGCCWSTTC